jgi:hypothetical protein
MKTKIIETTIIFLCGISVLLPVAGANQGGTDVHKTAQQYISDFRQGVEFRSDDPIGTLVINHRVDKSSLSMLTKELATGTQQVREKIVRLLEKIGLDLDAPAPNKFPIIRDHSILRALLIEGFAKDDSASSAAAGVLRRRCKPTDLAAFNDLYIKSLQQSNGDYLYLAAKAKTTQASPFVDNLARLPAWQKDENGLTVVKIAQAALGNAAVEDEFIKATYEAEKNAPPAPKNRFYNVGAAKDGKEVAARLNSLGLIGTQRSLLVVCTYLRSTLKTYVPNIKEQSIRYDALDAIRYNFPDERVLYRPTKEAEWAAAELFCTQNLGAVFEGPTPDLPPDLPYPTRLLPRPIGIQR